ncbi:MAG: hypothetical protein J1F35_03265 [Erysipelotrichales bacterium]|nr:hypothetical protein [Erysipelotrichales bacterium]
MDDKTIIQNYLKFKKDKESQNKPSSESKYLISKIISKEEKEYIKNRWTDSSSDYESLYRIVHNIQERHRCPVCGKFTEFVNKNDQIYRRYCSWECKKKNTNMAERHKQGCLKKYGVENISQVESIKEQKKQTFLRHYGTENNFGRPEVTKTILDKYGVDNIQKLSEIKEKVKQTCLKKYGYTSFIAIPEEREKWKESNKEKEYITKKKNGTLGKSLIEIEHFKLLKNIFPNTIHQYREKERYPFNCDLYVPELDLFIELNYYYTHQETFFDKNNPEHIERLNHLKELTKNGINRQGVIDTWADRDLLKRKTAKNNKLNYLAFFNKQDFIIWINEIKKYNNINEIPKKLLINI